MDDVDVEVAGQSVAKEEFLGLLVNRDEQALDLLVRQLKAEKDSPGNTPGLVLFALAFRVKLTAYIRRFLGTDETLTGEAWNDTLYRVHSRIDKFDAENYKFTTWMFIQARHAAITRLRQHQGYRPRKDAAGADAAPSGDLSARQGAQRASALGRAMRRLSETERKLVRLHYLHGYKYVEIARDGLMGSVPEDHVRVYGNRAIKKLKEFFDEELDARREET